MTNEERHMRIFLDVLSRLEDGTAEALRFASRKHGITQARVRQAFGKFWRLHKTALTDLVEDEFAGRESREPTYSELVEGIAHAVDEAEADTAANRHLKGLLGRISRAQFPALMQKRR